MNDGREHTGHENRCKAHLGKSERDEYRICPSKLSKRELEDLYFRLIDTNIQLKKTINTQQDQLKVLSTRLQRAQAQKSSLGKEKNCCVNSRAVIDEQKYIIADLKKSNERLSERIRLLNMRLCSARQFLKRSPPQCSSRCTKNCNLTNTSIKNSSMSALNTKISESNPKIKVASYQYIDKESTPRKLDETLISQDKTIVRDTCDENKCKTLMEELKQKVTNLEEELFKTHEEYAHRITKLEDEVLSLGQDNARTHSGRAALEQRLQLEIKQSGELTKRLRNAEAQCDDLVMELTIKEHKVRELETQVKAADISSHVAKALDDHFNNTKITEPTNATVVENEKRNISPTKAEKQSDDSGYADHEQPRPHDKSTNNFDSDVMKQLVDLQSQLNTLKGSVMDANDEKKHDSEEATCSRKRVSLNMNQGLLEEKSIRKDSLSPTKPLDLENQSTSREVNKNLNNVDVYRGTDASEREHIDDKHKHNICQIPGPLPVTENRRQSIKKNGHVKPVFDIQTNVTKKGNEIDVKIRKRKSSLKTFNQSRRSSEDETLTRPTVKSSTEEEIYETNLNSSKATCECPKDDANQSVHNDTCSRNTLVLKNNTNVDNTNKKHILNNETDIYSAEESLKVGKGGNVYKIPKNKEKCNSFKDIAIQSIKNTVTKVCVNRGVGSDGLESMIIKGKTRVDAEIQVDVNHCKGVCRDATVETSVRRPCDKPLQSHSNKRHRCDCARYVSGDLASEGACRGATLETSVRRPCDKPLQSDSNKRHRCECARYVPGDLASEEQQTQPIELRTVPQTKSSPSRNTYVVQASTKLTRIRTPDNTENEISSLTDLPTERSSKSPEDYISPGEDRCVSTLSETYTATITDYGSLSEGELPIGEHKHLSYGEVTMKNKTNGSIEQSSSTQVEEALKQISKELARCRQLLHGQHFNKVIPAPPRAVEPF